ncbi:hypothetical protein [Muricoccus radiodurans]|uniref:hypothetical protein n=1 Tax=Muricoccus radiodurans TaxID=2231721 RepID=UPI003CF1F838
MTEPDPQRTRLPLPAAILVIAGLSLLSWWLIVKLSGLLWGALTQPDRPAM